MGELDGSVALITGAARGQGRSHAVLLAEEGADIVGLDICTQLDTVSYPMATVDDLEETKKLVEKTGRSMVAMRGDVRTLGDVKAAVEAGRTAFGRLDIVVANAGIMTHELPPFTAETSVVRWRDSIDTMLTGVWNTLQATVPVLIEQGQGGCIIATSSTAGLRSYTTDFGGGIDAYYAAKHGIVGLCKAYANTVGPHRIRVNTVHPGAVETPMIMNEFFPKWVEANPKIVEAMQNTLPTTMIQPIDISRAILYLASEAGRFVTGTTHVVDAGQTASR